MLSKLTKLLGLSFFSIASCYADGTLPAKPYKYEPGRYLGLSLGPKTASSATPLFYEGVQGTLSLGWGHIWSDYLYWNRTYTAFEGFVGDSIPLKKFGPNQPVSVINTRTGFGYGLDGIVGYMVNPYAFIYMRSGVENTHFQITTANAKFPLESTYHTAWRLGGGAQGNLYKNIDVRMEYIFSLYPTQTIPVNIGRQFTNLYNFGVVYRFV